MITETSYIKFPKYNFYPSNLLVGFKTNEPRIVIGKNILIILDITGSMGEMINNNNEGTKMKFAKNIIDKIINAYPFSIVKIMPFNDKPNPLISFNEIPEPSGCTNFSPILPEVIKIINTNSEHNSFGTYTSNYTTTILISDGIPSEDKTIAHNSIQSLGSYCREVGTNTISIAIGTGADGYACSLFTGNRGYNCFVKYNKDIEPALSDIINGIKCNYVQVSDGNWIPIEESGNYYYLSSEFETLSFSNQQLQPTYETIRKYISLIIQNELCNPDQMNIENLTKFIKETVSFLQNEKERNELIEFFTNSLVIVKNTIKQFNTTPSITSAVKQAYQSCTRSASGI